MEEKAFEQRGLQPCPGWMSEKSLSPERASGKIPLSPESSMATLMVTHSKSTTRFCRVTQCGYPRGSVAVMDAAGVPESGATPSRPQQ